MTIKSIAITDFLPPQTQWPAPTMPMAMEETCLAYCEDGALLAIRYLDANEVLNKIPRDNLFALCVALKQRSPWAYFIIGGGLEEANDGKTIAGGQKRDGWHWSAVQGALLSVQELGVAVLHIPDERELGAAVARLGKRDRTTKRLAPQKTVDAMSVAEDMLLCLPGIGAQLAHRLLADCGENFIWSLIALVNSDCSVPGVGEKTCAKIREALGLLEDQNITLIQPGDQIVPAGAAKEIAA